MNIKYSVIGIMSGTSLDGIDLIHVSFFYKKGNWSYIIHDSKTYPYSQKWILRLKHAPLMSAQEIQKLHNQYGVLIGKYVNTFLQVNKKIDFIASHGHTIFHEPKRKFTFQLGNGANVAATTKITTISDFRVLDVALGGQGAPLVPIGDKLLFTEYDYCINLGGFANLSYSNNGQRIAYDICPVNIITNQLVGSLNMSFDKNGLIGSQGKVDEELLKELNDLEYYQLSYPKSLGREWVENKIMPILEKYDLSLADKIRTLYEHSAIQIVEATSSKKSKKILFTGGGVYNSFLMNRIQDLSCNEIIIPKNEIVEFKEALIFAFLGVLRFREENNCLASVTGAKFDNSGGCIFKV